MFHPVLGSIPRRILFALWFTGLLLCAHGAFAQADPRFEGPLRIEFGPPNPGPGQEFTIYLRGTDSTTGTFFASCGLVVRSNAQPFDYVFSPIIVGLPPQDCRGAAGPLRAGTYTFTIAPPAPVAPVSRVLVIGAAAQSVPALSPAGVILLLVSMLAAVLWKRRALFHGVPIVALVCAALGLTTLAPGVTTIQSVHNQ